jgi:tRNA dimethylallyltransferase
MQVYDGLRILTARPAPADEARVPHRLYGHVSAATRYSVGAWLADAAAALAEAAAAGALAIVVGGTGLYFKSLTEGLAPVPAIPPDVRARWTARLAAEGVERLHAELAARDPRSAAALRPTDTARILRALEVIDATGRSLAAWREAAARPALAGADVARFVIETDRDALAARIAARVDRMVESGALEEVAALVARGLDPDLPAMKAIGVRPFAAHLAGEISLGDALAAVKAETRRYAKRQRTWFRHQTADWPRTAA